MDNNVASEKRPQTNEEIIDELTKGLEDSAIRQTPTESRGENKESEKDKVQPSTRIGNDKISDDPFAAIGKDEDEEEEQDGKKITELPDDFIDEEALKDREIDLTEEQREALRKDAESLKNEGNELFKSGEYQKAMDAYTRGIQTCSLAFDKDRSILYANRAAAKMKYMENKDSAISDCTKALELNSSYLKAYLRRAQLYEESDKLDEALEDFKKILTFDPAHSEANYAVRRLPPLIAERNEKLKTEMIGKLKDLGNMVLRPFGLSTDNFELKQDPNSGGYSVNFNQTPR
ncbi:tetratricopeptide repeat protein 1 [Neodiprion pinetum]|uniref:Tetratricopeptide repeat protein 1 n=1 Tax=Neodiprion lecontei TaxID=441921 RepID=A0A6J0BXZ2_NEOLC|nr:tetratricopeptide repeat protein 1 [Neodiprion lecontei]XP_046475101.1 tetratricopeptide repeat protein 1 [Neodiprion pinetum]